MCFPWTRSTASTEPELLLTDSTVAGRLLSSYGFLYGSLISTGKMGNTITVFQPLHVVILGLDSAGKTTVLYRLKFNEFVNTVPTIGFNAERVRLAGRGVTCHLWDAGGHEKLRALWRPYSRRTDGIVYVVDSVDVERLDEARAELHRVARFSEHQGAPLLVLANKQDLPGSLSAAEVERRLDLQDIGPGVVYHVQPACAIIGEGLHEGMDKLCDMIVKRRKSMKQKKRR